MRALVIGKRELIGFGILKKYNLEFYRKYLKYSEECKEKLSKNEITFEEYQITNIPRDNDIPLYKLIENYLRYTLGGYNISDYLGFESYCNDRDLYPYDDSEKAEERRLKYIKIMKNKNK